MYDREQQDMDEILRQQRTGLILRAVGWILILTDVIPLMFIWTAWRAGSNFWMWWFIIEGVAGVALAIAGSRIDVRSGKHALAEPADRTRRAA